MLVCMQESDDDEYDDAEDRARKAKKREEMAKKRVEESEGILTIEDQDLSVLLRCLIKIKKSGDTLNASVFY